MKSVSKFFIVLLIGIFLSSLTTTSVEAASKIKAFRMPDNEIWFFSRDGYMIKGGHTMEITFLKIIDKNGAQSHYLIASTNILANPITAYDSPSRFYPFDPNATLQINGIGYDLSQIENSSAPTGFLKSERNETTFILPSSTIESFSKISPKDNIVLLIPAASGLAINSYKLKEDFLQNIITLSSTTRNDFALYDMWANEREETTTPKIYNW